MKLVLTMKLAPAMMFAALCLLSAGLRAASIQAPATAAFERHTLENGLRIIVLPMSDTVQVACRIVYEVGSADDPAGMTGMAHFLEHMQFKGTDTLRAKNWKKEELALAELDRLAEELQALLDRKALLERHGKKLSERELEREAELREAMAEQQQACQKLVDGPDLNALYQAQGASDSNAWTAPDQTVYTVTLPANKLEVFFLIESRRMTRSVFREFHTEREVVLAERARAEQGADRRYAEARAVLLWEATPYRQPNLGWPDDVRHIRRSEMFAFYRKHYIPSRATLVFAGGIDLERAKSLALQYFGDIPRGAEPLRVMTRDPLPFCERVLEMETPARPRVDIALRTVAIHHRHRVAFDVLAHWLAADSGPLRRRLMHAKPLAINVWAHHVSMLRGGSLSIGARGATAEVNAQLLTELADVLERYLAEDAGHRITPEDIASYAASVERDVLEHLSEPEGAANLLVAWAVGAGVENMDAELMRIRSLTPPMILEIAAQWLTPENRVVSQIRAPRPETTNRLVVAAAELIRRRNAETDERRRRELDRLIVALRARLDEEYVAASARE